MFQLATWIFKTTVFAIVVLILGHYVKLNGQSVSDQVRTQLSFAERILSGGSHKFRELSAGVNRDARDGAGQSRRPQTSQSAEKIPPSERQRLRALLQELSR